MRDETDLRLDAIHFVRALRERWVAVPAGELRRFRIHLKGQSGIFKPAELTDPLSLTTTITSRHTQDVIEGSCVLYDYVSRDYENDALKRCGDAELPLIYFLQTTRRPSPEYVIFAPVYVAGWDDETRRFLVDLSEQRPSDLVARLRTTRQLGLFRASSRELTTSYVVSTVQQRLDEARFRNAVLDAYRDRCAVCDLHVRAVLDAAHVSPEGNLDIRNGIALCGTHHRAFGAGILTFDEEYVIHIHLDRRSVGDGERNMLLAYDGRRLNLPSDESLWPASV